jgi:hypothetical protein
MRWLRAAIARLLGIPTEQVLSPSTAQQTQTAGPASKELTPPRGSKRSAPTSTQRQPRSPAQPRSPKEPKAAPSTSPASKGSGKKQEPAPTGKSRKAVGSSSPTPARRTRQHAK